MALLSQGIVGGEMRWPLVVFGIALCLFLILIQAPSPMLIAVGMYLPLQTTFAIFVGGFFRWLADRRMANLPEERRSRGESAGTLIASGLIAGEALMGVGLSGFAVWDLQLPVLVSMPSVFRASWCSPSWAGSSSESRSATRDDAAKVVSQSPCGLRVVRASLSAPPRSGSQTPHIAWPLGEGHDQHDMG